MAAIDIEVRIRKDGVDITGSPFIRRIIQNQALDFDSTIPSSQVALGSIPGAPLSTHNVFFLNPQNTLTIHLNGGTDIVLNPGALVLLIDAALTAAEQVSNGTGVAVEVLGTQAGN